MSMFYQAGRYRCKITKQQWGTSKGGYPQLIFSHEPVSMFVEGPEGPQEQPVAKQYERNTILTINPDSEDSKKYSMLKLRNAGFDGADFSDLDMIGSVVEIECEANEYEGKERERWEFPLPPKERGQQKEFAAFDAAAARKLNAIFGRQYLKPAAGKVAETAKAPATGTVTSPPDDEIPF